MWLSTLWLLLGLGLILWGANALTDGSSALAKRLGVSDLVIGLTVVAFGTSAPELVISMVSAFQGSAELAIGNVVGSNIFNVFMIVGMTAMVSPIKISTGIMTREIPLVILSSLALLAIGASDYLGGGTPVITRVDGILLLLFFAIFMRYVFSQTKNPASADANDESVKTKEMPVWKSVILVALGLAGLVYGGDRFVDGASGIAAGFGVSKAVIGLTIVAAGTSLPELATSVVSALKGRPGIAVGNVIGSNIFNIFLVLGLTGTIMPLPFNGIGIWDLLVMTAATILFWIFGWFIDERTITRGEGGFMVLCYFAYTIWLILNL